MVEICFIDYYDTIVHRSINPEHVKKLWANMLVNKLDVVDDIYQLRFEIEKQLCEANYINYGEHEFQYDEMCRVLYNRLKLSINYDEFILLCKTLEVKIEKHTQYLNVRNVDYIKNAKNNGQKIYLISDFYFDKLMFIELLNYHGIYNLFDDIFISSELLKSKKSGALYQYIKTYLKLDSFSNCLMIGDNTNSDIKNAELCGIKTKFINSKKHYDYYDLFNSKKHDFGGLVECFNKLYLSNYHVDYIEVALAIFLFIVRLHSVLKENNARYVLFMSRAGEFLKKLYDQYSELVDGNITSYYFLVSRRATFLPSLRKLDEEDFNILFREYRTISIREFLMNINFDDSQIKSIAENVDFDIDVRLNDLPTSEEFIRLKHYDVFRDYYEDNRITQFNNIHKYVNSIGIDISSLFIVDVGWKGSIQDNLEKIFPDSKIYGYYLGLNQPTNNSQNKHGLLFNPHTAWDSSLYDSLYNECTSIFEVILAASHGSVRRYLFKGIPDTINNQIESKLFTEKIVFIQESMFNYVRLISLIYLLNPDGMVNYIDERYADFILCPLPKQMAIYDELYHVESFGVHEVTKFTQNGVSVFTSMFEFIRNPRKYINYSFWPAHKLYINKLSFLLPLYKFYKKRKLIKK